MYMHSICTCINNFHQVKYSSFFSKVIIIAADGYTYERESIIKWFKNNQKQCNNIQCVVSPITGDLLTTEMTFSNHQLFKQIQDYRKANNIN